MELSSTLQNLPARSATPSCRVVDYMRISITDRCNERCLYCMPEQYTDWLPRGEILTYEEILEIVRVAVTMGFKHFRVTGGEPLVRRDAAAFMGQLCAIPGVESTHLTTNATRLAPVAEELYAGGLRRLNISLDALDAERYQSITHGDLKQALTGIEAARQAGFRHIKLNTVLMRGKNEDQILPLVRFAAENDLILRFIELMPVSLSEMLDESNFMSALEARNILEKEDDLERVDERLGQGPASYWRLRRLGVTVGFIGALTDLHFCDNCNKVRLTADGKIRPCLGNHGEVNLIPALRPSVSGSAVRECLAEALREKPPEHLFRDNYQPGRIMTAIGG